MHAVSVMWKIAQYAMQELILVTLVGQVFRDIKILAIKNINVKFAIQDVQGAIIIENGVINVRLGTTMTMVDVF